MRRDREQQHSAASRRERFFFEDFLDRSMGLAYFLMLSWLSIVVRGSRIRDRDDCFGYVVYICDEKSNTTACDCANRDTCHFKLVIEDATRPTSNEPERVIHVNGAFQGPTLIVKEDATVVVDVVNNMRNEGTSIHWHGMHQISVPWMDGVGYITQWPIRPGGGKFRYTFKATPPGTMWYHSHSGTQRAIGFFGALIVKEKTKPVFPGFRFVNDEPDKHTLVFLDFPRANINGPTRMPARELCLPDNGKVPDSVVGRHPQIVVNGRNWMTPNIGRAALNELVRQPPAALIHLGNNGTRFLGQTGNKDVGQFSTFRVKPGETYRFRLVGAMESTAYRFSIDNHTLYVVGADGYLVEPFPTDYIIIHSGERFDFLLTTNSTISEVKQFPIRTESLAYECLNNENLRDSGSAVLLYGSESKIDIQLFLRQFLTLNPRGCSDEDPCLVVNCPFEHYGNEVDLQCHHVDELQLLNPTPADEVPDSANIDLARTTFFNFDRPAGNLALINGIKFVLPSTPLQVTHYNDSEVCEFHTQCVAANTTREECVHIATIPDDHYMKSVRFVLSSLGDSNGVFTHPVHLHGHSFHVVKFGYPTYDMDGRIEKPNGDLVSCDGVGPPHWKDDTPPNGLESDGLTVRKDTVMVPAGGYVVIDFFADNPGYWFMHCHIDHHMVQGMGIAIRELKGFQNPPPKCLEYSNTDFCCTLDLDDTKHDRRRKRCCQTANNKNRGHKNRGHKNRGHKNRGHKNRGHKNRGHKNRGHKNRGHKNRGHKNRRYNNWGHNNWGHKNWGHKNRYRTLKKQPDPSASLRNQKARKFDEEMLRAFRNDLPQTED